MPQSFETGIQTLINSLGTNYILPAPILTSLEQRYDSLPVKAKVDLSNFDEGKDFFRRAFGDLRYEISKLGLTREEGYTVHDIYGDLCRRSDQLLLLKDIHEQVLSTVKDLNKAET